MDRTEVLEALAPLGDLGVRTIDHNPHTRVVVGEEAVLRPGHGQRHLLLKPEGVKSLCEYSGLARGVAKQLTPDTFSRAATELLGHKGRYSVLTKEGEVVAFHDPSPAGLPNIAPERVLNTVEKTLKTVEYFRVSVQGQDSSAMVEVVGEREQAVARGDLVRAGVMLRFSPIGTVQPIVQAYALRLACTNGATSNTVIRQFNYTGGEGDNVYQWFRQSVRECYSGFSRIIGEYRKMAGERIRPEDRAMMLDSLLQQAGIRGATADAVRARALEEPPHTAYDVYNLVTWAHSHLLETPAQVQRALTATAGFSDEENHSRSCPVCHRSR